MSANTLHWTKFAIANLQGKKIVKVRYMSDEETNTLGWGHKTLVLQLDDGSIIFPSQDDEGNGPGALHGQDAKGNPLVYPVI